MMKGRKEMNEMVWNDLWQRMQQSMIKIEERSYIIHGKGLQESPSPEPSHKPRLGANPRLGGA